MLDQPIQKMNFDQFLMKARYASNLILLLVLNKMNFHFQSHFHRNVKLCRKSNKPLPVTIDHTPNHQGATVEQKQKRVKSQEVRVDGHASTSFSCNQNSDLKMIVQYQMFPFHIEIYSSQQQGCQSSSNYYRITNFVKFESRQCWINHYFRIRLKHLVHRLHLAIVHTHSKYKN